MHKVIPRLLATVYLTLAFLATNVAIAHAQGNDPSQDTDEGRIYWSQGQSIFRGKFDGSDPEVLLTGLPLRNPVFNTDGTQMYGIGSDDVIRRANLDGTELTELLTPGNDPSNLKIDTDGGKLYWLDDTSVRRANLDGGQVETLVTGLVNPVGLRLDLENGKLYWTEDSKTIRRANLDGTTLETIYTADPSVVGVTCLNIDPVDKHVYWLLRESGFNGPVMRANDDGTGVTTLPIEDICPTINVDNRKLYWIGNEGGDFKIQRSNLNGSSVEDIVTEVNAPNSLSFDQANGLLYWYEATLDDPKIRRAPLDGGPAQNIVLLPANPASFALNLVQGQMMWEINGVLVRADLDGENPATVIVGVRRAGALALDLEDDRIFWSDASSIRVANLDGSEAKIFWTGDDIDISGFGFGPPLVTIDEAAGKLYWITTVTSPTLTQNIAQSSITALLSANLDGSALQEEGKFPLIGPFAIDLVNQKVYGYRVYMDDDSLVRELTRVNFDGTASEGLGIFDNQTGSFLNLAVDGAGGKIYWTVGYAIATIQQANLDGTEQSELLGGLDSPSMLTIDTQGGQLYWTSETEDDGVVTERANMDGSGREILFESSINSFAFDPEGLGNPLPQEPDEEPQLRLPLIRGG